MGRALERIRCDVSMTARTDRRLGRLRAYRIGRVVDPVTVGARESRLLMRTACPMRTLVGRVAREAHAVLQLRIRIAPRAEVEDRFPRCAVRQDRPAVFSDRPVTGLALQSGRRFRSPRSPSRRANPVRRGARGPFETPRASGTAPPRRGRRCRCPHPGGNSCLRPACLRVGGGCRRSRASTKSPTGTPEARAGTAREPAASARLSSSVNRRGSDAGIASPGL